LSCPSTISPSSVTQASLAEAPIRLGSDAHKKLFCRTLLDTFNPYKPAVIDWPELDAEARALGEPAHLGYRGPNGGAGAAQRRLLRCRHHRSLVRARDIAVGVTILLIWQGVEGQRALAARRAGNLMDSD
jgi:hypothetical protein